MRTVGIAASAMLAISTGGVAVAASASGTKITTADCVKAWNAAPIAPSIKALRGTHGARIQVFNSSKYQSGCIVSILRPGPNGIIVLGSRRGAQPIQWRIPTVAHGMTTADVRTNAVVSTTGLLSQR
jgi:hypothetical protein